MEKQSSAHLRGRAYRCLHCLQDGKTEVNTKQRLEDHVYKYHVPNAMQPYWCRLCLFRCRTKESLFSHVRTYARHKNVMAEKGVTISKPFLVCTLNPHVVGEQDIEVLSKEESMRWWLKKELPSPKLSIIERAAREAEVDMTMEKENPVDVEGYDMEKETEQAALDLRVIIEQDVRKMEEREVEVLENKGYVKGVEMKEVNEADQEQPLDLRVVIDRAGISEKVKDVAIVDVTEKEESRVASFVGGEKKAAEEEGESEEGKETTGEAEQGKGGIQDIKADRKRMHRDADRKERARKRVRHTLKNFKAPSPSSSSTSSSSSSESDSDSDSDIDTKHARDARDAREQRYTDILGEMIRKTGEIIGGQIIANAALINKLQSTVEDLRKEVVELRQEKRIWEQSRQNERREGREKVDGNREETRSKDVERREKENDSSMKREKGNEQRQKKGKDVLASRGKGKEHRKSFRSGFKPYRRDSHDYGRFGYRWGDRY